MSLEQYIVNFWRDFHEQNWSGLAGYFSDSAVINFHHTNEQFTLEEYIRLNAEYPGVWDIGIERVIGPISEIGNTVISVTKTFTPDKGIFFHAISFYIFEGEKIAKLDEYWGEGGEPPKWRKEMKIGRQIESQN